MSKDRLHGLKDVSSFGKVRGSRVDEVNIINESKAKKVDDLFSDSCSGRVAKTQRFHDLNDHRAYCGPAGAGIALECTHVWVLVRRIWAVRGSRVAKGSTDVMGHLLDDAEHRDEWRQRDAKAAETDISHGVNNVIKTTFGVVGADSHGFMTGSRVIMNQTRIEYCFISLVVALACCLLWGN